MIRAASHPGFNTVVNKKRIMGKIDYRDGGKVQGSANPTTKKHMFLETSFAPGVRSFIPRCEVFHPDLMEINFEQIFVITIYINQ
jgi:hypothetical protein